LLEFGLAAAEMLGWLQGVAEEQLPDARGGDMALPWRKLSDCDGYVFRQIVPICEGLPSTFAIQVGFELLEILNCFDYLRGSIWLPR
jgi:hypothetical protein